MTNARKREAAPVRSWAQFDRVIRRKDASLLSQLPRFRDAVLVAGCQRSGTTVVTRILRDAIGMGRTGFTRDDELDAALILNGAVRFDPVTRCCFQTTYLNDHVHEYFEHDDYRLVWILRNPEAVVTSMLVNWRRGALNRLFRTCGMRALDEQGLRRFQRFGTFGFRRIEKACLSYNVKTAQVHELAARLGRDRLLILDYDVLISERESALPEIFRFASIAYDERYAGKLRSGSAARKNPLSKTARTLIRDLCDGAYRKASDLALRRADGDAGR